MEKLIITPKTKIYDLLESYPELEDMLVNMAPEYAKLKNPILRKTIAKVATISQAAVIAGLNVEQMVNQFREKVGLGSIEQIDDSGVKYVTSKPGWFDSGSVVKSIDIREFLNRGEQPVHEVLASAKSLEGNQILEVIAPFIPAPLLDKSLSLGYSHWLDMRQEGEYRIYLTR